MHPAKSTQSKKEAKTGQIIRIEQEQLNKHLDKVVLVIAAHAGVDSSHPAGLPSTPARNRTISSLPSLKDNS